MKVGNVSDVMLTNIIILSFICSVIDSMNMIVNLNSLSKEKKKLLISNFE